MSITLQERTDDDDDTTNENGEVMGTDRDDILSSMTKSHIKSHPDSASTLYEEI